MIGPILALAVFFGFVCCLALSAWLGMDEIFSDLRDSRTFEFAGAKYILTPKQRAILERRRDRLQVLKENVESRGHLFIVPIYSHKFWNVDRKIGSRGFALLLIHVNH